MPPAPYTLDVRWHLPPTIFIKLNIDGAYLNKHRKVSIGGIFRSSQGEYKVSFGTTPLSMELQALKYGLQLEIEHNLMKLEIDTDATNIINLLESDNYNPHNNIISKYRYWMKKLGNPPYLP